MSSTLLSPHIPCGIHVEWIYSMDSTWIPHGICVVHYGMDIFHGIHMDSIWIPHGIHRSHCGIDIFYRFHMESIWNTAKIDPKT
jgi:hypothetical protein